MQNVFYLVSAAGLALFLFFCYRLVFRDVEKMEDSTALRDEAMRLLIEYLQKQQEV